MLSENDKSAQIVIYNKFVINDEYLLYFEYLSRILSRQNTYIHEQNLFKPYSYLPTSELLRLWHIFVGLILQKSSAKLKFIIQSNIRVLFGSSTVCGPWSATFSNMI